MKEDRQQVIEAVNLIKENRDDSIKGCTCANGIRHKQFLKEDELIASPEVSLEGLFTTLITDAKENRDVEIFDVPGLYLPADMPRETIVILRLVGIFVEIMCGMNP